MGAHVVQPRARRGCGACGVRFTPAAPRGLCDRRPDLCECVVDLRARTIVRRARRRALRSGGRRGADRHGCARSPCAGRRGGRARAARVGRCRCAGCGTRACGWRRPHAAPGLGVDLPRAGAGGPRSAACGSRHHRPIGLCSCRAAVGRRQCRAATRRWWARRGALPRRAPARGRVGDVSRRRGPRRHRDAADGDRRQASESALGRDRARRRSRRDPHRGRSDRARAHAARRLGVDDPATDPRGCRSRAHGRRPDGARAPRSRRPGRSRRLDARRTTRRRRPRPAAARAGADDRARGEPRRGDSRGCRRRPRQRDPAARQARCRAGRARRGRPRGRGRQAARRRARACRAPGRRRVARARRRAPGTARPRRDQCVLGTVSPRCSVDALRPVPVAFLRRRPE